MRTTLPKPACESSMPRSINGPDCESANTEHWKTLKPNAHLDPARLFQEVIGNLGVVAK